MKERSFHFLVIYRSAIANNSYSILIFMVMLDILSLVRDKAKVGLVEY